MASHIWMKTKVLIMASHCHLPLWPDLLPWPQFWAFWTLGSCRNTSQAPVSRSLHLLFSWPRSRFLHSVQLVCSPLGTFTQVSPFQGGLISRPIAILMSGSIAVWCPPWRCSSVVYRGTSRWAAGLLNWKIPVAHGNLCDRPLRYKLSRELHGVSLVQRRKPSTSRWFSAPLAFSAGYPCVVLRMYSLTLRPCWPPLLPLTTCLPIPHHFTFSIASPAIQEMRMWGHLFKSFNNFKVTPAQH